MTQLSICVPVYNQNVTALLESLLEQRKGLEDVVEILVFEDGSAPRMKKYNSWLASAKNLIYQDFEKNVGRAAIRNRLGQAATGECLLFLDDDSRFEGADFLIKYLKLASKKEVVCGGRHYPPKPPTGEFALHWTYGSKRESRPAEQRNREPYDAFHSNNFMVPKSIFMKHHFDESLRDYGHEDTLFGYNLSKNRISVRHIDNPVIHAELDSNIEFLEKSKLALQNLRQLYQRQESGFNNSVKILRAYEHSKKSGSLPIIIALFKFSAFSQEQHLLYSERPSMRIFNFYKLGYFATLR